LDAGGDGIDAAGECEELDAVVGVADGGGGVEARDFLLRGGLGEGFFDLGFFGVGVFLGLCGLAVELLGCELRGVRSAMGEDRGFGRCGDGGVEVAPSRTDEVEFYEKRVVEGGGTDFEVEESLLEARHDGRIGLVLL
jgi:hypothetical protein